MKFYIASRTARATEVQRFRAALEELGHEVYDWTMFASIKRPYEETEVAPIALAELQAIENVDVFILLGDEGGTGMYVELGYALATGAKVYCVGNHNDVTVFQYIPQVIRVQSFDDLVKEV